MTREELQRAKDDLLMIQQEREKIGKNTKEGKKLIIKCLCGAVLACGLAVSTVMGVFNLEQDSYVYHKTTNVYTNEIVTEVEQENNRAVYHRTRYVVYNPWKYDNFSGTYERTVQEFDYAPIHGDVNIDSVQENLTLVESYLEKKDSLDRSDSTSEPTLIMEEYIKEHGMTDWKKEYRREVFGTASIMAGIMTGLFSAGVVGSIFVDTNFYGYYLREKTLRVQEQEAKEKLVELELEENPLVLRKVRE